MASLEWRETRGSFPFSRTAGFPLPSGIALFAAMLLASGIPRAQPCRDYACDSAAVRAILDANSLDSVSVAEVSLRAEDRITLLDLQYRGLDTLPPDLGRLSSLRTLRLDRNALTGLPPGIGGLRDLRFLLMDNNRLRTLPGEIGDLDSLALLVAFSNELDSVPSSIGKLTAITELRLEDNRLTRLPPEILALKPVLRLDVSGNRICALPESIAAWVDLYASDPDWRATQKQDGAAACASAIGGKAGTPRPPWVEVSAGGSRGRLRYRFRGKGELGLRVYDGRGLLIRAWRGSRTVGMIDLGAASGPGPYWIRAVSGRRVSAFRIVF